MKKAPPPPPPVKKAVPPPVKKAVAAGTQRMAAAKPKARFRPYFLPLDDTLCTSGQSLGTSAGLFQQPLMREPCSAMRTLYHNKRQTSA